MEKQVAGSSLQLLPYHAVIGVASTHFLNPALLWLIFFDVFSSHC